MIAVLLLDSEMMSFSVKNHYSVRGDRTLITPSKSAIAGIIAKGCCVDRKDSAPFLFKFNAVNMTSITYVCSSEIILEDYQTIGGRKEKDGVLYERFNIRNFSSKIQEDPVIKKKQYLVNTFHYVIVNDELGLIDDYINRFSVSDEVIYLGRKSCLPSRPIYQGVFASELEARDEIDRQVLERIKINPRWRKLCERKDSQFCKDSLLIHDVVNSFDPEVKTEMSRFVVDTFFDN